MEIEAKRTMSESSLKYISIGLLTISLLMSHFAIAIDRYDEIFSDDTILNLWLWSWLPTLLNCVFVLVFRKYTPTLLIVLAWAVMPTLNLVGILQYMFYGFGHMTWS